MNRPEFPEAVKRVVAERSAFICSNPECRTLTVGPASDEDKALRTGDCAHITAASMGGPRYDPGVSPDERNSPANAIWLCATCHRRVDSDPSGFSADVLRQWKSDHEEYVKQKGMVPAIPELQLNTTSALTLLEEVAEKDSELYRECTLRAKNRATVPIKSLRFHLVLPERAAERLAATGPAGVIAKGERFAVQLPVEVRGRGVVVGAATIGAESCVRFFVERLDPEQQLICKWLVTGPASSPNQTAGLVTKDGKQSLYHYLRGRFQYDHLGGRVPQTFWRTLTYEPTARSIDIGPPVDPDPETSGVEVANPRPSATGEYWG